MKVLICPNRDAAIDRAGGVIVDHVAARPQAVLGLATGGTMIPPYQRLVNLYREGRISFAGVTTFNLDEYVGIARNIPAPITAISERHCSAILNRPGFTGDPTS